MSAPPPPPPAPVFSAFTHKAALAQAIQFDGTIPCLLTIFNAVPPNPSGVQVTINFDGTGVAANVILAGTEYLSFGVSDWMIIPGDGSPMFVASSADFARDWQA